MNEHQRQLVLLIGFMSLLAVVVLFLFVYAPEPLNFPLPGIGLPEPLASGVEASVKGWKALVSDFGASGNVTG